MCVEVYLPTKPDQIIKSRDPGRVMWGGWHFEATFLNE